MKAKIYSNKLFIGTTDLQIGDENMGCIFGEFVPTENYFKYIQKSVWKFWKANKPDYKKWSSLRFNVQLENGYFLYPIGGYTFEDNPDLPNEPKRIDIAGIDRDVLDFFSLQNSSNLFIEEPWEDITINQKIGFEEELSKEIGLEEKSMFDFLKPKQEKHKLSDFKFSALCKYKSDDDVLFEVRNQNFEKQFAVIHLTWKGKKEIDGFPGTDFFKDFNEFRNLRMIPDKNEWEELES
ncbi:hypothetical protein [Flavobacterium sp. TSSA_36]|uniref:hypothetical protein n=1 Tax=Flavobacterium sp. TSSA_36 TaxID=3447669 RepID=UPI003F41478F